MKQYSYIIDKNMTMADVFIRINEKTPEDLFSAAAYAMISVMLENPDSIEEKETVRIDLHADEMDILLYDFLGELVYRKDADGTILLPSSITFTSGDRPFALSAELSGEKINKQKHMFRVDVKAVTMHRLEVKRMNGDWSCSFVMDV